MVMGSNDPLRKAFRLAREYITNYGIILNDELIYRGERRRVRVTIQNEGRVF